MSISLRRAITSFFGSTSKVPSCCHGLDLFQTIDTALDGLEVGQHSAEPSLIYIVHSAALSLGLYSVLSLFLGTNEKDVSTLSSDIKYCLVCGVNHSYRFLKVDDVDAVSLGVDVGSHFGVPSSGLMTKMYAGFE